MMDLRKIMKRAWEIKKEDNRNIFSLCLKMAWEEAKNMNVDDELKELVTRISDERGYSNPITIEKKLWKTSDGKKNRTYITIRACKRMFQFWIDNTDDGICRDFNAMNSVSKEVKKRVGDFIKAHASELKLA